MFSDVGLQPGNDLLLPGGEDSLPFNILVSIYLLAYPNSSNLTYLRSRILSRKFLDLFLKNKKFEEMTRDDRSDNDHK